MCNGRRCGFSANRPRPVHKRKSVRSCIPLWEAGLYRSHALGFPSRIIRVIRIPRNAARKSERSFQTSLFTGIAKRACANSRALTSPLPQLCQEHVATPQNVVARIREQCRPAGQRPPTSGWGLILCRLKTCCVPDPYVSPIHNGKCPGRWPLKD